MFLRDLDVHLVGLGCRLMSFVVTNVYDWILKSHNIQTTTVAYRLMTYDLAIIVYGALIWHFNSCRKCDDCSDCSTTNRMQ